MTKLQEITAVWFLRRLPLNGHFLSFKDARDAFVPFIN